MKKSRQIILLTELAVSGINLKAEKEEGENA
jgi:hypothetical protein